MKKTLFVFFVLIFTAGCEKTVYNASNMPNGITAASQLIGTYYGDIQESSSVGTQNSEPILRAYGVTLEIDQGATSQEIELTIKLCDYYSEGTIVLDLRGEVDLMVNSDGLIEFEVFNKRFPTEVFPDRRLVVNGGMGEINAESNILMNLSITTESRNIPEVETHNVWSTLTIDTNAEGAGNPDC